MIRGGWTLLIDGLKTYLETGQPLEFPQEEERRKGGKVERGERAGDSGAKLPFPEQGAMHWRHYCTIERTSMRQCAAK
jgi:hypothetical protein